VKSARDKQMPKSVRQYQGKDNPLSIGEAGDGKLISKILEKVDREEGYNKITDTEVNLHQRRGHHDTVRRRAGSGD
jgi:hypothetical protein